jgi:hypothetical protein
MGALLSMLLSGIHQLLASAVGGRHGNHIDHDSKSNTLADGRLAGAVGGRGALYHRRACARRHAAAHGRPRARRARASAPPEHLQRQKAAARKVMVMCLCLRYIIHRSSYAGAFGG